MSRHKSSAGSFAIGLLVLLGIVVSALGTTGGRVAACVVVIGLFLAFAAAQVLREQRRKTLLAKYGDAEVVARIMNRTLWVGESSEQLKESFGLPIAVDDHVLKTKRKETWKYLRRGKNRFGLRVVVENGTVVGWDHK